MTAGPTTTTAGIDRDVVVVALAAGPDALTPLISAARTCPDAAIVALVPPPLARWEPLAIAHGAHAVVSRPDADPASVRQAVLVSRARRARERELTLRGMVDALTGLPTRTLLWDRLESALARGSREGTATGVLFVDLDGLKSVNDRHGHATGDLVLRTAAGRLDAALRPGDTIARYGGDEFVVVCDAVAGAEEALAIGWRLLAALARRTGPEPGGPPPAASSSIWTFGVRASIGVVVSPVGAHGPRALIGLADGAMYAAKRAGGGTVAIARPTGVDARPGRWAA